MVVATNPGIRSDGRTYCSHIARELTIKPGISDPVAAVERLAGQLLIDAGVDSPPVPLELLASFQGIMRAVAVPYRDERLTQRNRIISLVYRGEDRSQGGTENGGLLID